jgi:hypothetical protein
LATALQSQVIKDHYSHEHEHRSEMLKPLITHEVSSQLSSVFDQIESVAMDLEMRTNQKKKDIN